MICHGFKQFDITGQHIASAGINHSVVFSEVNPRLARLLNGPRPPKDAARVIATQTREEESIVNAHISEYAPASRFGHAPKRERKLLLATAFAIVRQVAAAPKTGRLDRAS